MLLKSENKKYEYICTKYENKSFIYVISYKMIHKL